MKNNKDLERMIADLEENEKILVFLRKFDYIAMAVVAMCGLYIAIRLFVANRIRENRSIPEFMGSDWFLSSMTPLIFVSAVLLSYIIVNIFRNKISAIHKGKHKKTLQMFDALVASNAPEIDSTVRLTVERVNELMETPFIKGRLGYFIHIGVSGFAFLFTLVYIIL